jgi:hypothetical protein
MIPIKSAVAPISQPAIMTPMLQRIMEVVLNLMCVAFVEVISSTQIIAPFLTVTPMCAYL